MASPLPDASADRTHGEASEAQAPSDEALMERFCQGDGRAFDALYLRYRVPLHGFFRRMVGSTAAADDLLQVTFLHVVKARGRYARGEPLRPWLYAIARNAARDHLRLAHHREVGGESSERSLSRLEAPEEVVAAGADEVAALQRALAALPPKYREAVVMHQLEGLSFTEVARAVDSTPGAVKVRAHRGYQRLREVLAALRRDRSGGAP